VGLCVNLYFVLTLLLDLESYGYDSPIVQSTTRRLSGRHRRFNLRRDHRLGHRLC